MNKRIALLVCVVMCTSQVVTCGWSWPLFKQKATVKEKNVSKLKRFTAEAKRVLTNKKFLGQAALAAGGAFAGIVVYDKLFCARRIDREVDGANQSKALCPICLKSEEEVPESERAKSSCCKQFFCRNCMAITKANDYPCPLCQNDKW